MSGACGWPSDLAEGLFFWRDGADLAKHFARTSVGRLIDRILLDWVEIQAVPLTLPQPPHALTVIFLVLITAGSSGFLQSQLFAEKSRAGIVG